MFCRSPALGDVSSDLKAERLIHLVRKQCQYGLVIIIAVSDEPNKYLDS